MPPGIDDVVDSGEPTLVLNTITEHDDLKAINGIGPEVESFLVERGISDFRQVGSLSDVQIECLERQLPESHRRIRADDWVEQTRNLYNQKFSDTGSPLDHQSGK